MCVGFFSQVSRKKLTSSQLQSRDHDIPLSYDAHTSCPQQFEIAFSCDTLHDPFLRVCFLIFKNDVVFALLCGALLLHLFCSSRTSVWVTTTMGIALVAESVKTWMRSLKNFNININIIAK